MKRTVIIGSAAKPHVEDAVRDLLPWLEKNADVVAVDLREETDLAATQADLVLVFGGDGALLSAARRMRDNQMPTIGVKIGRLGFLSELLNKDLQRSIEAVLADHFEIHERTMIHCSLVRNGDTLLSELALNDVVVCRGARSRLFSIALHVDGEHATDYNCDGLIVSTPTGSTGHSLSAGGPIVAPGIDAFVVAPICPHTLTNRSLVLSATQRIELDVASTPDPVGVTIDGQVYRDLEAGDRIRIERANVTFKLIYTGLHTYFETLRTKLGWGGHPNYDTGKDS